MEQTKPDNHYCSKCYYMNKYERGRCDMCSYSELKGFNQWTPMSFNGTTVNDLVNKPKHYMLAEGLEVRDVLTALVSKIQNTLPYPGNAALFESDYVQMMQYLMRFMDKNGKQDLEKARWYLDKLIAAYD